MLIKTPTRPRKELPPLVRDPKCGVGAHLEHAVRIVAKKKLSRSRDPELACHERRPDHYDLEKFGSGKKRTLEKWKKKFLSIDFLAKFVSSNYTQFDNCKQLEYMDYQQILHN